MQEYLLRVDTDGETSRIFRGQARVSKFGQSPRLHLSRTLRRTVVRRRDITMVLGSEGNSRTAHAWVLSADAALVGLSLQAVCASVSSEAQ